MFTTLIHVICIWYSAVTSFFFLKRENSKSARDKITCILNVTCKNEISNMQYKISEFIFKKSQGASALGLQIPCVTHIGKAYDFGWDFKVLLSPQRGPYTIWDFRWVFLMYILFWRVFENLIYFIQSLERAVNNKGEGGDKQLGLSEVNIHQEPYQAAKHRFLPFFPKCVTYVRTYGRKKNQTSKVSLCCKRTGSKNEGIFKLLRGSYAVQSRTIHS